MSEKMKVKNEKFATLHWLSFFFGFLGVDRFYVGKKISGIIKLSLILFFILILIMAINGVAVANKGIIPAFAGIALIVAGCWWIIDIMRISEDKFPIKKYREATEQEEQEMKIVKVTNEKWETLAALSFLFGLFGLDRFYVGKIFSGILKLSFFTSLVIVYLRDKEVFGDGELFGLYSSGWYIACFGWLTCLGWWIIDNLLIAYSKFPIKKYREATEQDIQKMREEEIQKQEQARAKERQKQEEERQRQRIANAEYKRTCKACGSVWHSSVAQENSGAGTSGTRVGVAGAILMGSLSSTVPAVITLNYLNRAENKEAAHANSLNSARHCPKCGSGSYNEEVVYYE